jgi:hypothetical protein
MNCKFVLCISMFALFGCASVETHVTQATHSLAGNRRLPQNDIKAFIPPADWAKLCDLEYDRYVVMAADIREDGSVIVGKVTESYPDASWNQIARSFGKQVILRATRDGASMLPMRAEIYVVFFKPQSARNFGLIFGQEIDAQDMQPKGGRMIFNGTQLGPPDMEISHRPKYMQTFTY